MIIRQILKCNCKISNNQELLVDNLFVDHFDGVLSVIFPVVRLSNGVEILLSVLGFTVVVGNTTHLPNISSKYNDPLHTHITHALSLQVAFLCLQNLSLLFRLGFSNSIRYDSIWNSTCNVGEEL